MRLFLLRRKDLVRYEEFRGFVVRAEDESQARALAVTGARECYPEPLDGEEEYEQVVMWRQPERTSCEPIDLDAEPQVILSDYRNG